MAWAAGFGLFLLRGQFFSKDSVSGRQGGPEPQNQAQQTQGSTCPAQDAGALTDEKLALGSHVLML